MFALLVGSFLSAGPTLEPVATPPVVEVLGNVGAARVVHSVATNGLDVVAGWIDQRFVSSEGRFSLVGPDGGLLVPSGQRLGAVGPLVTFAGRRCSGAICAASETCDVDRCVRPDGGFVSTGNLMLLTWSPVEVRVSVLERDGGRRPGATPALVGFDTTTPVNKFSWVEAGRLESGFVVVLRTEGGSLYRTLFGFDGLQVGNPLLLPTAGSVGEFTLTTSDTRDFVAYVPLSMAQVRGVISNGVASTDVPVTVGAISAESLTAAYAQNTWNISWDEGGVLEWRQHAEVTGAFVAGGSAPGSGAFFGHAAASDGDRFVVVNAPSAVTLFSINRSAMFTGTSTCLTSPAQTVNPKLLAVRDTSTWWAFGDARVSDRSTDLVAQRLDAGLVPQESTRALVRGFPGQRSATAASSPAGHALVVWSQSGPGAELVSAAHVWSDGGMSAPVVVTPSSRIEIDPVPVVAWAGQTYLVAASGARRGWVRVVPSAGPELDLGVADPPLAFSTGPSPMLVWTRLGSTLNSVVFRRFDTSGAPVDVTARTLLDTMAVPRNLLVETFGGGAVVLMTDSTNTLLTVLIDSLAQVTTPQTLRTGLDFGAPIGLALEGSEARLAWGGGVLQTALLPLDGGPMHDVQMLLPTTTTSVTLRAGPGSTGTTAAWVSDGQLSVGRIHDGGLVDVGLVAAAPLGAPLWTQGDVPLVGSVFESVTADNTRLGVWFARGRATGAVCTSPFECASGLCQGTCGEVDGGASPADAGVDAGTVDAGSADAGSADAGSADAGSADAGSADAGSVDAGPVDAGPVDAGPADAGPADAGPVDAGSDDAGSDDAGSDGGSGTSDAGLDGGPSSDAGTSDGAGVRDFVVACGCSGSLLHPSVLLAVMLARAGLRRRRAFRRPSA